MACGFIHAEEAVEDLDLFEGDLWYAKTSKSPSVFGARIVHVSKKTVCFQDACGGLPIRMLRGDVEFIERVSD